MSAREQFTGKKLPKREGVERTRDKDKYAGGGGASFFSEFRRKIKELEAVNTHNMRPSSSELPAYPREERHETGRLGTQIGHLLKKELPPGGSNFSRATTSSTCRLEGKAARPSLLREEPRLSTADSTKEFRVRRFTENSENSDFVAAGATTPLPRLSSAPTRRSAPSGSVGTEEPKRERSGSRLFFGPKRNSRHSRGESWQDRQERQEKSSESASSRTPEPREQSNPKRRSSLTSFADQASPIPSPTHSRPQTPVVERNPSLLVERPRSKSPRKFLDREDDGSPKSIEPSNNIRPDHDINRSHIHHNTRTPDPRKDHIERHGRKLAPVPEDSDVSKSSPPITPALSRPVDYVNTLSVCLSDYEDLGEIGRGQFGSVHKVALKSRPNKPLAWKKVDYRKMSEKEKAQLAQEVRLLQSLNHDGVVKFGGKINDKESKLLYLIMEYCDGGDLNTYLEHTVRKGQPLPEETIVSFFSQIARALLYCHTRPEGFVLHRDLKPQNVFLAQNYTKVKLGDFGLAKRLQPSEMMTATTVGTPYYMSPEVLRRSAYDHKSDMWALGCLLFEMASGVPPHSGATSYDTLQKMVLSGSIAEIPYRYTPELRQMVKRLLTVDSRQRPSASEILETAFCRWGDAVTRCQDLTFRLSKFEQV